MVSSSIFVVVVAVAVTMAMGSVRPGRVRKDVAQGQIISVAKTITLDDIGSARVPVDVCFVQDATGSVARNGLCEKVSNSIPDIAELFGNTDARYSLKTFKDYVDGTDEVYQSRLTTGTENRLAAAYERLCVEPPSGGGDFRDAQYDAIVRAVGGGPGDCGWREGSTRIMFGVNDGGCKGPQFGPEYINSRDSVIAALRRENVMFFGITIGGRSTECFQPFARESGGAIMEIGDSSNLGAAVSTALSTATFQISPTFSSQCDLVDIVYDPPYPWPLQEGDSITVNETITIRAVPPIFINCNVVFPLAGLQRLRFDVLRPSCGNNVVEEGEQCDEDTEACDADCTCSNAFRFNTRMNKCVPLCGNNRVDRFAGEQCDGSPFCLDTCKCRVNFTPRRSICRCLGGNVVMGECILR